jgi:IS30 family transposase
VWRSRQRPRATRPIADRGAAWPDGRYSVSRQSATIAAGLVLLAKMDDATAASALAGFSAKLTSIAAPLRKSFTYDQGKEMSRHVDLAAQTDVKVYFCDPHSPWQRGTCENTNGLIRQYLPKGTDLSVFSQDELDGIADSLNTRPRATHDWHTPLEVFAQTLASSHKPSNSVH